MNSILDYVVLMYLGCKMKQINKMLMVFCGVFGMQYANAHYPYIAPLSYQTFNNHTAILSGFYDNPFVSEIAIKNFKFHYHIPTGEKIYIDDEKWVKTQTLASYSLENKIDGTYRIRGEKQGNTVRFAQDGTQWKSLISGSPKPGQKLNDNIIYASQLKKNSTVKSVQTIEFIETFMSRRELSNHVVQHLHDGFDVQFITHPNAIKVNQPIQFKLLDNKNIIAQQKAEILVQTTDFSRNEKVYKTIQSNEKGELNFVIQNKGQYLLVLDYQQPLNSSSNQLKRYKYTLAFNVTD